MTRCSRLTLLASAAGSLLLPLCGSADSHLAPPGQQFAEAHLMFKIVIPQVLSVEIGQALAVGGNTRSPFLWSMGGSEAEWHQVILSTAGHHSIAQFAACSRAGVRDAAVMNCTVSMP